MYTEYFTLNYLYDAPRTIDPALLSPDSQAFHYTRTESENASMIEEPQSRLRQSSPTTPATPVTTTKALLPLATGSSIPLLPPTPESPSPLPQNRLARGSTRSKRVARRLTYVDSDSEAPEKQRHDSAPKSRKKYQRGAQRPAQNQRAAGKYRVGMKQKGALDEKLLTDLARDIGQWARRRPVTKDTLLHSHRLLFYFHQRFGAYRDALGGIKPGFVEHFDKAVQLGESFE